MTDYLTPPDAEALAIYAVTAASITDLTLVSSSRTAKPVYPCAVISRGGGGPVEEHSLDSALIDVSVWADNKADAHDIAQDVRLAILRMAGTTYTTGGGAPVDGTVTGVRTQVGLRDLYDDTVNKDRYVFSMMLSLRAVVGAP
jgi:hypothetical protein